MRFACIFFLGFIKKGIYTVVRAFLDFDSFVTNKKKIKPIELLIVL